MKVWRPTGSSKAQGKRERGREKERASISCSRQSSSFSSCPACRSVLVLAPVSVQCCRRLWKSVLGAITTTATTTTTDTSTGTTTERELLVQQSTACVVPVLVVAAVSGARLAPSAAAASSSAGTTVQTHTLSLLPFASRSSSSTRISGDHCRESEAAAAAAVGEGAVK